MLRRSLRLLIALCTGALTWACSSSREVAPDASARFDVSQCQPADAYPPTFRIVTTAGDTSKRVQNAIVLPLHWSDTAWTTIAARPQPIIVNFIPGWCETRFDSTVWHWSGAPIDHAIP